MTGSDKAETFAPPLQVTSLNHWAKLIMSFNAVFFSVDYVTNTSYEMVALLVLDCAQHLKYWTMSPLWQVKL